MNKLDIIKIYILLDLVKTYSETLDHDSFDNSLLALFEEPQKGYLLNSIEKEEIAKALEKLITSIFYSSEEDYAWLFYIFKNEDIEAAYVRSIIYRRKLKDLKIHFTGFLDYLISRIYVKT